MPTKGYDPKCEELAEHFLTNATVETPSGTKAGLAQYIQDAVEEWFFIEQSLDGVKQENSDG